MEDIKIIDNFLPSARSRRSFALSQKYEVEQATGVGYPGIAKLPKVPLRDRLHLAGVLGGLESVDTFFRLTLPRYKLPTFIHNDVAMGKITGILYLNDEETRGGTAFWRHKESGLIKAPTPEDLARLGGDYMNKLIEDGLDESKWEMTKLVDMEFNRLLLFNAELWHSCYPRGGWGEGVFDGRLIQVYFLR